MNLQPSNFRVCNLGIIWKHFPIEGVTCQKWRIVKQTGEDQVMPRWTRSSYAQVLLLWIDTYMTAVWQIQLQKIWHCLHYWRNSLIGDILTVWHIKHLQGLEMLFSSSLARILPGKLCWRPRLYDYIQMKVKHFRKKRRRWNITNHSRVKQNGLARWLPAAICCIRSEDKQGHHHRFQHTPPVTTPQDLVASWWLEGNLWRSAKQEEYPLDQE
jgi:hypothetical protein